MKKTNFIIFMAITATMLSACGKESAEKISREQTTANSEAPKAVIASTEKCKNGPFRTAEEGLKYIRKLNGTPIKEVIAKIGNPSNYSKQANMIIFGDTEKTDENFCADPDPLTKKHGTLMIITAIDNSERLVSNDSLGPTMVQFVNSEK
ncbi:hypothetical protein [Aquitalea magnusonii]|uniref:Lipoprotein n=1 Tax=Aquitalea magnusonii TaxID=332411 RepID=A0A318J8H9_9NEIS|nr:hypothetical protein [Aquitalea magnusonii]PXX42895.1 hypothetical protein DFR38_1165 [Aquitalea magnusonii]